MSSPLIKVPTSDSIPAFQTVVAEAKIPAGETVSATLLIISTQAGNAYISSPFKMLAVPTTNEQILDVEMALKMIQVGLDVVVDHVKKLKTELVGRAIVAPPPGLTIPRNNGNC